MSAPRTRAAFRLRLPAGWERVSDPAPGVALVAVEPPHDLGFRANFVVTADELPYGVDLQTWQSRVELELTGTLHDYLLLDLETVEAAAGAAVPSSAALVRRLAHHMVDGEAVTMHQWARLRGCTGFTLTASVATLAYDSLADTFEAVAASFCVEPDGEAAG